jgi:hypothetical protein
VGEIVVNIAGVDQAASEMSNSSAQVQLNSQVLSTIAGCYVLNCLTPPPNYLTPQVSVWLTQKSCQKLNFDWQQDKVY